MTIFEIERNLELLKKKQLTDKDFQWCLVAIEFLLKGLKNQK